MLPFAALMVLFQILERKMHSKFVVSFVSVSLCDCFLCAIFGWCKIFYYATIDKNWRTTHNAQINHFLLFNKCIPVRGIDIGRFHSLQSHKMLRQWLVPVVQQFSNCISHDIFLSLLKQNLPRIADAIYHHTTCSTLCVKITEKYR